MRILSKKDVDVDLRDIQSVADLSADAHPTPYSFLRPEDFERLVYLLYRNSRGRSFYDSASLAISGADRGRDVWLTKAERPVGLVQCKRSVPGFSAPAAVREVVKFLLFTLIDPALLPEPRGFRYTLALTSEPARTTIAFFQTPKVWIRANSPTIEASLAALIKKYATFKEFGALELLPKIQRLMTAIDYELLRPDDLNILLDAAPIALRRRFFQTNMVLGADASSALMDKKLRTRVAPEFLKAKPVGQHRRRKVAARLAKIVAGRLDNAGIYKRGRTIRRHSFDVELERFLKGTARVFPVIGYSGVGKSSALAELADRDDDSLPSRLLVRGADITSEHAGIDDLLVRLPWAEAGMEGSGRSAMEGALADHPVLLLVDGLNEKNMHSDQLINSWVPNTIAWLLRRDVKLLITCRPELWSSLELSFPAHLLHREGASEGRSPTEKKEDALEAQPARAFRLTDFTRGEAGEALTAYGLAGRIAVERAAHPFLLAVAESLGPDASLELMDFDQVIEAFIDVRVARAVGGLGQPTWRTHVASCLEEAASRMLLRGTQVLSTDELEELFGRYRDAIDVLCREHLLAPVESGFRFQHDQVQEFFQTRRLSLSDVLARIPPLPLTPDDHPFQFLFRLLVHFLKRRGYRQERMPPVVVAGILGNSIRKGPSRELSVLLRTLSKKAQAWSRHEWADWARQCVLSLLSSLSGNALHNQMFAEWLVDLLARKDAAFEDWMEDVARAAAGLLIRSTAGYDTKRFYLELILLREHDFHWRRGELGSEAFWERQRATEGKKVRPDDTAFEKSVAGPLIAHLVTVDASTTLAWLGKCLDDERRLMSRTTSGRTPEFLSVVAMRSLYRSREADIETVIDSALAARSPAAADLVEALAHSNPEELEATCLALLENSDDGEERHHLQRALWVTAKSPFCAHSSSLEYALDGLNLAKGRGLNIIWCSRIFFARRERHKSLCSMVPGGDTYRSLVEDLRPFSERALMCLQFHLTHNDVSHHLLEDYLYLLGEEFDTGLDILEQQRTSSQGLQPLAFSAIVKFIWCDRMKQTGGAEQLKRLILFLNAYIDSDGQNAVARIAFFALRSVEQAGMNVYEFSADEVHDLGLLDLAGRIIRRGGDAVSSACGSLVWPVNSRIRKELFSLLRSADILPADFEGLIFSLCTGGRTVGRVAAHYIFSLRIAGREEPWDKAAVRFLFCTSRRESPALDEQIVAFWQQLPQDRLTGSSLQVLQLISEGYSIKEAACPVNRR